MNKLGELGAGVALSVALASGCASPAAEQPPKTVDAKVVGFWNGIDAAVYEMKWIQHVDDTQAPNPDLEVLNSSERDVFDGCHREYDWFGIGGWGNDGACDGDSCMDWKDEDELCKADYRKGYTYDQKEPVLLRRCPAPQAEKRELKEEPTTDTECLGTFTDGQIIERTSRFIIWVSTTNPDYNSEKPDEHPKTLIATKEISESEWQTVSRQTPTTASIKNDSISAITLG